MNHTEYPNIEELLNSFIDGELTEREQTEVQRLIAHDTQVAKRLQELQKCKTLVGSLPCAKAPGQILDEIRASLQERILLSGQPEGFSGRAGARRLLVRKVLAAAAMIGLIAILGAVIYTIVVPESVPTTTGFKGRLELKTSDLITANAFINRAIEDNGLLQYSSSKHQADKSVYSLICSRKDLALLLADLENIWKKFDSATLFVQTKKPDEQVVVDTVTAKQIADLITIPKPPLTGPRETPEKPPTRAGKAEKVHLTIVVVGVPTDN